MPNEEAIFDFAPLKAFLLRRGYQVGDRKTYEEVKPEDVKPEDVTNGTMEFRTDGIFVMGSDGVERQVFLYKKDYRLQHYGKPKFHICKCSVIEEFINSGGFNQHYVRANTEPVPVIDLDEAEYSKREKEVSGLQLCKLCMRKINAYHNIDSTTFVNELKAASNEIQGIETDIFGYTRDWDTISKTYRESHQYTCENCGLKIEDDYDKQYVHVHHLNGNKENNDDSNLKCLCLYCHAHVDDHHYRRLTSGANKIQYCSFVARYGEEGYWNIDDREIQKAKKYMMDIYRLKSEYHITVENHFEGTVNQVTINRE